MSRPTALLILAVTLLAGCASVGERTGPEETSMTPSTPTVTPDDDRSSDVERAVEIIGQDDEDERSEVSADEDNETRDGEDDLAAADEDNTTSDEDDETARAENATDEWPTNGSFVTYAVHGISTVRSALRETDVEATWTYFDGEWQLDCEGEYKSTPRSVRDTVRWQNGTFSVMGDEETPRDASPLAESGRRGRVTAWLLEDCEPDRSRFRNATPEDIEERDDDAREAEAEARLRSAAGAQVEDALERESDANETEADEAAADDEEENATRETRRDMREAGQRAFSGRTREIVYDPDTGVVLSWREIGSRGKHIEAELVDTDAPL